MGLQVQQETLAQYSSALLSPLHPTSKRVREVARRVVEANGLGKMKSEGLMASLPKVSIWGGGEDDGWFGGSGGEGSESQATLSRGGERRKDIEWEVYVIKDDATKNAFVLPGGKIFVFTGILPVCKNDDGLASVLGHGIGGGVASVDFMSTHPANQKRIKALENWMPEALDVRAASPCGDTTSQFEAFREHLPLGQTGRVWG
ncbi:hypothetical protein QFC19_006215 [Naganishia cerealis]|uniref:Uncharacterized protein n=1 Tax=Naganishia cerealis TaxID=610337 RepID=A0ACC2VIW9_9TREE|nr:hypothetical protein QFC19_006215 [Naganishia cerealis]